MSELQCSAPPRPRSSSCSQNISPGSHFLCRSLLYRGNSEQWSANIVFNGQCYLNNLFVKSETKLTSFLFSRSLFLAESETAFWSLTSTSTSLTLIFTFEANSASSLSIGIMGCDYSRRLSSAGLHWRSVDYYTTYNSFVLTVTEARTKLYTTWGKVFMGTDCVF